MCIIGLICPITAVFDVLLFFYTPLVGGATGEETLPSDVANGPRPSPSYFQRESRKDQAAYLNPVFEIAPGRKGE